MRTFKNKQNGYTWDYNPYYDPENCDVTLLHTIKEPNMSYEFNMTIIVRDNPTGDIYVASDSGCSCPTPFERIGGLGDMTLIRNMRDFDTYFSQDSYHIKGLPHSEILAARRKIAELLQPKGYFI